MNQYDRRNLDFIMSMTPDQVLEFFEQMPEDDIRYAIELIQMAKTEVMIKSIKRIDNEPTDCAQARELLARIMTL
jgi:hypothetical protein